MSILDILEPETSASFELPRTLYFNAFAYKRMVTEAQEPVAVGAVRDFARFSETRNQSDAFLGKMLKSYPGIDRGPTDYFYVSREGYGDSVVVMRSRYAIDREKGGALLPVPFAHLKPELQAIVDHEYQLDPDLFWHKTMEIQKHTQSNMDAEIFSESRSGGNAKSYVHCDAEGFWNEPAPGDKSSFPEQGGDIRNIFTCYAASTTLPTAFLRDPKNHLVGGGHKASRDPDFYRYGCGYMYPDEKILRPPAGKIMMFNSAMLHFADVPVERDVRRMFKNFRRAIFNSAQRRQRTVLLVDFHLRNDDGIQERLARNTRDQSATISCRQPARAPA